MRPPASYLVLSVNMDILLPRNFVALFSPNSCFIKEQMRNYSDWFQWGHLLASYLVLTWSCTFSSPETGSFQHWLHFSPNSCLWWNSQSPQSLVESFASSLLVLVVLVHQVLETFQTGNFKSLLLHIETFKMPAAACSQRLEFQITGSPP